MHDTHPHIPLLPNSIDNTWKRRLTSEIQWPVHPDRFRAAHSFYNVCPARARCFFPSTSMEVSKICAQAKEFSSRFVQKLLLPSTSCMTVNILSSRHTYNCRSKWLPDHWCSTHDNETRRNHWVSHDAS